jgi:cytochrome c-type biogenesis protein CcmH/NrfG
MAAAGDWSGAAGAYGRSAAMNPANGLYRALYGEALYRTGRPDEARTEFQAASKAGLTAAHKYLGHIARDQGDAAAAVAHYQEYLKSSPADRAAIEQEIRALSGG